MYTISVVTSQHVVIQYPVASIGERIGAYLIDRIILSAYIITMLILFVRLNVQSIWIWICALAIPFLLFSLAFEIFMNGQTPGKRLLRIQVVRLDGSRARVGDFVLRWLLASVDFAILGGAVATIVVAAGGKGQRLGDVVAGTCVIQLTPQKEITAAEVFIAAENNYKPVYPEAIQLQSSDIELMHRVLDVAKKLGNDEPAEKLTEKIKARLGIQTDLPTLVFLQTLIKDHSELTSRS